MKLRIRIIINILLRISKTLRMPTTKAAMKKSIRITRIKSKILTRYKTVTRQNPQLI